MNQIQENKNKQGRLKPTAAFRDLLIIGISCIVIFILSYFFSVFNFIVELFQKFPSSITWVDEIITLLVTLSIAFGIFSWRRLQELKEETKERIRLQEELLSAYKTQMEAEKIISKQLHSEIEIRKEAERKHSPVRKDKRITG
jgi:uncharacterized membrane protein YcjF (UPF0283 family)